MTRTAERGAAMLEFAISFMVVFSLLAGTFQWGYTFYVYNRLVSQVRAGARYAASQTYDANTELAVKNMVVYGNARPTPDAEPCVTGLETSNVSLTTNAGERAITVAITGFTIDSVFGRFPLEGRPNATFPYTGTSGLDDVVAHGVPDELRN